jgi:hypothetical protein
MYYCLVERKDALRSVAVLNLDKDSILIMIINQ